jgi:hypothetical protein
LKSYLICVRDAEDEQLEQRIYTWSAGMPTINKLSNEPHCRVSDFYGKNPFPAS